jgi:sugar fermentation stimulation protein A
MGLRPEEASATRKTRWTSLLVEAPGGAGWVSLNTTLPNRLIERALRLGALQEFDGWHLVRREVPYGSSRLDFLLEDGSGNRQYVEVKSVTLVHNEVALFPDAITARGARHVEELTLAVVAGHQASVLFVLQRPDAGRIVAARAIDPLFSDTLAKAEMMGVQVLGRRCHVSWEGIALGASIPASAGDPTRCATEAS